MVGRAKGRRDLEVSSLKPILQEGVLIEAGYFPDFPPQYPGQMHFCIVHTYG